MTEATGCEAQTIHRLLEVSGNPEMMIREIMSDQDMDLEEMQRIRWSQM